MKTSALLSLTLFLFAGFFVQVNAQKSFVKAGDQVRIQEPVQSNAYVAGGKIYVESEIKGDLVAAGGTIRIQEKVGQDIILMGGDVYLDAEAGGDLRIGAGNIRINQNVAGDLTITGGEITIAEGVKIGGDVFVAGGQLRMHGQVGGDLHLAGGEVWVYGRVEGNLSAHSGQLRLFGVVAGNAKITTQELFIGDEARMEGTVRYWTKSGEQDFSGAMPSGATAQFDSTLRPKYNDINWKQKAKGGMAAFFVFRLLSGIILIFMSISLFGRFFAERAGLARKHAAKAFARGLSVLIALPLLSSLAMITVIGIPLGMIGFSAFTAFSLSAGAITAVVAAYEWAKWKGIPVRNGRIFFLSLIAFLGLRLVGLIPGIGWLFSFVLASIAIGHIIRHFHQTAPVDIPIGDEPDSDLV